MQNIIRIRQTTKDEKLILERRKQEIQKDIDDKKRKAIQDKKKLIKDRERSQNQHL